MKLGSSDWGGSVIHVYGYKIVQVHLCMAFLWYKHTQCSECICLRVVQSSEVIVVIVVIVIVG